MVDIVSDGQRPIIDYTGRDYASILRALREQVPQKLPEWKDFQNEADFGNVLLELFAYVADILSYYQDRVANESFLSTAVTRRSVIEHLRLIGYRMRTAAPAATTLTVMIPANVSIPEEPLKIHRGVAFATKSLPNKPSVRFEYTRESALTLEFEPKKGSVPKVASIPVEEGRLIVEDVVGESDETPDQRFQLTYRGLILRPAGTKDPGGPDVAVKTSTQEEPWTYQESLAVSKAHEQHFTIDIDENDQATVVFGDGTFGAIPERGTITATYRVGGGPEGNVGPHTIVSIVDAPDLAGLGAKVTNLAPATGGADRESIEHAVEHAPAVFRSHHRAVTVEDYEELAGSFAGVGKVRAAATGWNRVTLYVAPSGGPGDLGQATEPRRKHVSDTLELGLIRFLEDKRMITQTVHVEDVDYIPILVTAEVGIESYFVPEEVVAAIQSAVRDLMAFDNVHFGETVYLSRFYDRIQSTPGVRFTNIIQFKQPGQPEVEPSGQIRLGENQIPMLPSEKPYLSGIVIKEPGKS